MMCKQIREEKHQRYIWPFSCGRCLSSYSFLLDAPIMLPFGLILFYASNHLVIIVVEHHAKVTLICRSWKAVYLIFSLHTGTIYGTFCRLVITHTPVIITTRHLLFSPRCFDGMKSLQTDSWLCAAACRTCFCTLSRAGY